MGYSGYLAQNKDTKFCFLNLISQNPGTLFYMTLKVNTAPCTWTAISYSLVPPLKICFVPDGFNNLVEMYLDLAVLPQNTS